ncbi:MAG: hypothetical protein ACFE7I_09100 [Candidatus Hodarchaeota archaeon]
MSLLSAHETIVWELFHKGKSTSEIADVHKNENWSPSYVSRVLNRARKKIEKALRNHAVSHRLDIESVLDYKGLLIGYDYQTASQVFLIFTLALGIVVWYKHADWSGKLCPDCPKRDECRETLDTIIKEYDIKLRPDEETLHMTEQSVTVFHKLAAKEVPRYRRKEEPKEVVGK